MPPPAAIAMLCALTTRSRAERERGGEVARGSSGRGGSRAHRRAASPSAVAISPEHDGVQQQHRDHRRAGCSRRGAGRRSAGDAGAR